MFRGVQTQSNMGKRLNPSSCKNSKCLADDLVITCDEIKTQNLS